MFDYIFVGSGVAATLLLDELLRSSLKNSKILLIDCSKKNENDRILSFWEEYKNTLEHLVYKSWSEIEFVNDKFTKSSKLKNYKYKCIRGKDLKNHLKKLIKKYPKVSFVKDTVVSVTEDEDIAVVHTSSKGYKGRYVFDSRFEIDEFTSKKNLILNQYFRGWKITTKKPTFNPQRVSMFDLRVKQEDDFRFIYLLPFSETQALVEVVTHSSKGFNKMLKIYIEDTLGINEYTINGIEQGVTTLTDMRFDRQVGNYVMKIGTAGGLIKPSSGYGFTRMHRDAKEIVNCLVKTGKPFHNYGTSDFYFNCDSLLLRVLNERKYLAIKIFSAMFKYNHSEHILRFLDEKASYLEIFRLMCSMYPLIFIREILKRNSRD